MMRLGPHHHLFEPQPPDPEYPGYSVYAVADVLDLLPSGLWASHVRSTYYHRNSQDGATTIIRASMGVLLEIQRTIREQDRGLVLEEAVKVTCLWFLIGTMVGQVKGNCAGIHARFVEKVKQRQGQMLS